jgi:hypothetical protein
MKNKLLPWQREVGPMLSESKEETLNSVQDFPLHFPPAEGGKLESFNLAGCSPRKVVLVEEEKKKM